MDIKTLEKRLSAINKVEKAICIPMALISIAAAIGDFFCSHYFWGTAMVLCAIYWASRVRICFMKQKSRAINIDQ